MMLRSVSTLDSTGLLSLSTGSSVEDTSGFVKPTTFFLAVPPALPGESFLGIPALASSALATVATEPVKSRSHFSSAVDPSG